VRRQELLYTPAPMPHPAARWTRTWPWVIALAFVALTHILYYFPRGVDDMFIFLRYAENVAAGWGPVYNPGEAVEGFSSPLWLVLLALGNLLGLGAVGWSKFLGLLSFALLAVGTFRFARDVVGASARVAFASCLVLVLNSYVVSWTVYGLETPLHLALMMWTAVLAQHVAEGQKHHVALALAGTLFVWGRPESPLFLALIGVGVLLGRQEDGPIARRLARCAWPATVVVVAWALLMLSRRWYYGLWFPHTHYAKQGGGFEMDRLATFASDGATPWEVAVLAAGVTACLWLAAQRRLIPLLLALGNVFFASVVVLDWMPNVRHFLPLTILFPLVTLAAADQLFRKRGRLAIPAVLGTVLVATHAVNLARTDVRYSRFDFATHGRGKVWVVNKTWERWGDTWACLTRRRPVHVDRMNDFDHGMITQLYRLLESDARPLPETWYVGRDIGRVGWLSSAKVFDTDGLFTPSVVRSKAWIADHNVDEALVSEAFAREVVMTETFGDWARAAARSPAVRNAYEPVYGNWVYVRPRDGRRPSPQTVLARYEAALARMPTRYFAMTLYGEGVGAALERRVQHLRFVLEHGATVAAAPAGLAGGPTTLDGVIELLGCKADPAAASTGEEITLSCYFRALDAILRDYDVFVHFEGPAGHPRVNADHPPVGGFYRTREWRVGEIVRTAVRIPMPEGAGPMRAYVGLFIGNHRATTSAGATVDSVGRAIGPEVTRR